MVVLQIASINNDPYSGVPRAVPKMVNALKSLIRYYRDKSDTLQSKGVDQYKLAFLNVRGIKIEGIDCQVFSERQSLQDLPYPFNEPDLVVFHEVYYPPFLKLSKECRDKGIPYIIIPHGCLTKEALDIKKWKKRAANELLFKKYVLGAECLQFLSKAEKRNTIFKKQGFIGINGIELPERYKTFIGSYTEKKKTPLDPVNKETNIEDIACKEDFPQNCNKPYTVFTYIGRIDMHIKGLDILVRAAAEKQAFLRENLCCFRLYGPDCYDSKRKLTLLAEELGVGDIIEINGPVGEEEKEKVLLDSDIFIQLSRSEALPTGLLEALSYGLPCVVSKGTGLAELINSYDAGWAEDVATASSISTDSINECKKTDIKQPQDVDRNKETKSREQLAQDRKISQIGELVEKAVREKSELPRKSQNARKLIEEKFEVRKQTNRLLRIYKRIVDNSL